MSWVKRRDQANTNNTPSSVPPVPMFDPNQHSQQEMNQWSNPQVHDNWYNQQQQFQPLQNQQNYWQQPYNPSNYNQGYEQQHQQQHQQPQQQFHHPEYPPTNYRNNSYSNVQYNSEQYNQNVTPYRNRETDGDIWNQAWGDEDNSNVKVEGQSTTVNDGAALEDAFANDSSWNWRVEDQKTKPVKAEVSENLKFPKRGKLETPQWSTESQVSQESSDDVPESDKSNVLSRNSTISYSPQDSAMGLHSTDAPVGEFENKQVLKTNLSAPDDPKNTHMKKIGKTTNKSSPNVVQSGESWQTLYQARFHNQVNLETLPDNSEQPDPVPEPFQMLKPLTSFPENNETPINDRNQYLETGQLSEPTNVSSATASNYSFDQLDTEDSRQDMLPPPGLKRMVPGQLEQREDSRINRMVLGQNETAPNDSTGAVGIASNESIRSSYDLSGPPEGLHRMIPGESSSPESTQRQPPQAVRNDNPSEQEFQPIQTTTTPRSATIGADTPPIVPQAPHDDDDVEERRETIEGQNRETDQASNVTDLVRKLSLGEQVDHGHGPRESSDSDRERNKKPPRVPRERSRREKEWDRGHERDKYSPDYREKYEGRRRPRDRRYNEDTDYYSDKEKRLQDDREREYDRKYSSLRKEKDKERRRRDPRDYRRGDYGYERDRGYEDDYDNFDDNRSRPSSRSDSMHESYRERYDKERSVRKLDKDKERDRYRRRRDLYPNYPGYSTYDPYNPYYQQYQYYENLRRNNPHAYAEWYRKYYQQSAGQASSYGGEDRGSVHSGRSSANDDMIKDRYTRQSFYSQTSAAYYGSLSGHYDASSYSRPFEPSPTEDNTAQRLTPTKFSIAHLKASISSGKLLRVLPHYPSDGQTGVVEISQLESVLGNNEEYKELSVFPGPLVKGVTHKKTIIEYCENKIRSACYNQDIIDPDSYVLMWELLILLVRQNGMVVGTDIAELLLKNRKEYHSQRPASVTSNVSSTNGDNNHVSDHTDSVQSVLREDEVTSKFREFLLYGSGQEALEWAMKHGLWGHALFLASKLDKRTYANVMMRFANGLTLNDPLQTLYQLLSGKMPAVVTCIADEKWGDWRPHLAMILSNSSQRPELNRKAITTLGDTLKYRGSLYAAQFCYLMAEVEFSNHEEPEANLVLLGADHTSKAFPSFVTNESIHMTEIYEYACGLNDPEFIIPHFQVYKFILATRLADRGLLEKALAYLEKISTCIVANPTGVSDPALIHNVYKLADKLKFYDPIGEVEDETQFGTILETSRPDHSWLKDLRAIQENLQSGLTSQPNLQDPPPMALEPEQPAYEFSHEHDVWQHQYDQTQIWQPEQQQNDVVQLGYIEQQQQQNSWMDEQQQQQQQQLPQQQWSEQFNQFNQDQMQGFYGTNAQMEEQTPQQITLPNQPQTKKMEEIGGNTNETEKKKMPDKTMDEKNQSSTGWFGGIFSKLTLKPKNQMKLPDDKNPKIVWDETKKRWVNVDEDPNDPSNELKPPPKMAEILKPNIIPVNPIQAPLVPNEEATRPSQHSNMFKMQKGRNLKNSYVDVFKPNSSKATGPTSLPMMSNPSLNSMPQMNFFIPQPVSDANAPVNFLTPGGVPQLPDSQMSRWSSASSLSKEVQFYMKRKPPLPSTHSLT